jgi:hypothetical protein
MNYSFQSIGVLRTGTTAPYFGYSAFAAPSLNESALNETVGIASSGADTVRTVYYCPDATSLTTTPGTAHGPIDWNCDGDGGADTNVTADVNNSDTYSTLAGAKDWGALRFDGGLVGLGLAAGQMPPTTTMHELTYQEDRRIHG